MQRKIDMIDKHIIDLLLLAEKNSRALMTRKAEHSLVIDL